MTAWERFKKIENYIPFIIPIQSHELYVYESNYDGDPPKDWADVRSPHMVGDEVVKSFVEYDSGLPEWDIVPGYPYEADKEFIWKLRRVKDW